MNEAVKKMLEKYRTDTWQGHERALREVLQEIALVALWRAKFFDYAAFHGGTALRILYGLDRFSEDLDFTLLSADSKFNWGDISDRIVDEIGSYEFDVEMEEKKKNGESSIRSAFLKTNTLQSLITIGIPKENTFGLNPDKLIRIKIELDTDPTEGFAVEKKYIREPIPVSITSVVQSDLFASKLHAALFRAWKGRVKGRDWYDVVWFISRGTPLNKSYFTTCMRQLSGWSEDGIMKPEQIIRLVFDRIDKIDIESAKQDVISFLKNPMVIDEWTKEYFKHWISSMEFC
jgi:predicted nucleotidyltransferase component of viral defense system